MTKERSKEKTRRKVDLLHSKSNTENQSNSKANRSEKISKPRLKHNKQKSKLLQTKDIFTRVKKIGTST